VIGKKENLHVAVIRRPISWETLFDERLCEREKQRMKKKKKRHRGKSDRDSGKWFPLVGHATVLRRATEKNKKNEEGKRSSDWETESDVKEWRSDQVEAW